MDRGNVSIQLAPLNYEKAQEMWPALSELSRDEKWLLWERENYLSTLPQKWELSRLAYLGSELVGYCLCSARGQHLWIHRFVIAPAHRSKGFGFKILQSMKELCRDEGLKGIWLRTPAANEPAKKFYRQSDFVQVSAAKEYSTMRWTLDKQFSVGIHQPNYLPWLGYFYKMSLSDIFIFLDDVVFPKGSFVGRNRICVNGDYSWLTIPSGRKLADQINESFPSSSDWTKKHIRSLEFTYRKSPYFDEYFDELTKLMREVAHRSFADINTALIAKIASWIGINCITCRSSEMAVLGGSDERLVDLVNATGGSEYISGAGGSNYQSQATFDKAGIRLSYSKFIVEPYRQQKDPFVPALAVVDALFNIGGHGISEMFSRLRAERLAAES